MKTTLTHDKTNIREIFEAIKGFYPDLAAKDFDEKMIGDFINPGADPIYWKRQLIKFESNEKRPPEKKRKRRRRSAGTEPKGYSPARQVTQLELTDKLFAENE